MPRKTCSSCMRSDTSASSFNEAAARCRGKRCAAPRPGPWAPRFNEAAARCRGKPPERDRGRPVTAAASMRPRPDAAENFTFAGRPGSRGAPLQ